MDSNNYNIQQRKGENMQERIKKIEHVLYIILSEEKCSLKTANWLEAELDEVFPKDYEIQDFVTDLALYRPQGGDCLIDENELIKKCKNIWNHIAEIGDAK